MVVDHQRAALPGVALLCADEYVARGGSAFLLNHLDGRGAEVRARAEGPHVVRRRR
jgi:hypothetical protein